MSHRDYGRKSRLKGTSRSNNQAAMRTPCTCDCHEPAVRGAEVPHVGEPCHCRKDRRQLSRPRP